MIDGIDQLRRDYKLAHLDEEELLANPVDQFDLWLQQVVDSGIKDPNAMVVATVNDQGRPSQRIVLLKKFDQHGFVFFTNYNSRKAKDMATNSNVNLHFPWHFMERQVMISGTVEKVSAAESLKYFASRPFDSKAAAWASHQSEVVSSKTILINQFEKIKAKFAHGEVPLPDFWGGYRVVPYEFEFWQGGVNRLHDRFRYRAGDDQPWVIERLMP